MVTDLKDAFATIGAELIVEEAGNRFEIDIDQRAGREAFKLTYPNGNFVTAEALDVNARMRHLVLDVSGWRLPIAGRFLCGHDERHWFIAALPTGWKTTSVRGAMESLKPSLVLKEQKRLGVKHRLHRRKTAAYVRQGEWFFLPRPVMHVGELAQPNGRLTRPGGGKPHQVEWIYRPEGTDQTFVRGFVSHPDHETIHLQVWHRVVQNTEVRPDDPQPTPSRRAPQARGTARILAPQPRVTSGVWMGYLD